MNRPIIVITRNHQHMRNWVRAKNMEYNPNIFIVIGIKKSDINKIRGLARGTRYVEIDTPVDYEYYEKIKQELRAKGAIKLPLDINQWSIADFA